MSENIQARECLKMAKNHLRKDLSSAFKLYKGGYEEATRNSAYAQVFTSVNKYASAFADFHETASPLLCAVLSDNRDLNPMKKNVELHKSDSFFDIFDAFDTPFIGPFTEKGQRELHRQLADFYYELSLNPVNGLNSQLMDYDNAAIADTFYNRARINYWKFEDLYAKHLTFDGIDVLKLIDSRTARNSQIHSLAQLPLHKWQEVGTALYHKDHLPEKQAVDRAIGDYEGALKQTDVSEKKYTLIPPEQINISFLKEQT